MSHGQSCFPHKLLGHCGSHRAVQALLAPPSASHRKAPSADPPSSRACSLRLLEPPLSFPTGNSKDLGHFLLPPLCPWVLCGFLIFILIWRTYLNRQLRAKMQLAGIKPLFITKWINILQSRELGISSPLPIPSEWSLLGLSSCLGTFWISQFLLWQQPSLPLAKFQWLIRANIHSPLTLYECCWSPEAMLDALGLHRAWLSCMCVHRCSVVSNSLWPHGL